MSAEALLVRAAVGLAVAIYHHRELLRFAIFTGVLTGLAFIWRSGLQSISIKIGLTLILLAVGGFVVEKLKLGDGSSAPGPRNKRGGPSYQPACSTCNGPGRKHCLACSGSGQGPGSLGNVLGKTVDCFHCAGKGYVRCSCSSSLASTSLEIAGRQARDFGAACGAHPRQRTAFGVALGRR